MSLLNYLKGKIMARPKGSKNKEVVAQPQEFDYERDDATVDGAYQTVATTVTSAEFRPTEAPNHAVIPQRTPVMDLIKNVPAYVAHTQLYLVEGDVQLSSRVPGRGTMVAKQSRLVKATSDTQAVQKFSAYFSGLSDAESVYTVVRAAAMETIN